MHIKVSRKTISNVLLIIIFTILLCIGLSKVFIFKDNKVLLNDYEQIIQERSRDKKEKDFRKVQEYNNKLKENKERFFFNDTNYIEYMNLLNIQGNGLIGYLTAESISIKNLPIYHSSTSEVLEIGAGHLEGTSLPVGGDGTHSAISGHSGMVNQKMFTDLHKMEIGDEFVLEVMGEELRYEVDQIEVVEPDDLSLLEIEEGKDYCTLITCTPIGLNTHRLLVRGNRVVKESSVEEVEDTIIEKNEGNKGARMELQRLSEHEWVMVGIAVVIVGVFLVPDGARWLKGRFEKK